MKTHRGREAIDQIALMHLLPPILLHLLLHFLHLYLFHISSEPLFTLFSPFFFLNLPSPSLFFTLHCLFSDSEMWVSIFRCSSLPLISLPLSYLFFSRSWRTGLQKHSEIHQCCVLGGFWSAWWVTTQPRAVMHKCVFLNTFSVCKSLWCTVVLLDCGKVTKLLVIVT